MNVDLTCCGEPLTAINSARRNKHEAVTIYECRRCATPFALKTQLFITISERQYEQRKGNISRAYRRAERRLSVVS